VAPEELERLAREGAEMKLDDLIAYALETSVSEVASHVDEPEHVEDATAS
jgi:hypothetical protein